MHKYLKHFHVILILLFAFNLRGEVISEDQFHTTSVIRNETKQLVFYLERQHLLGRDVASLDQGKFIEDYLHDFDTNRLYLLQSDVNGFKERYDGSMADFLKNGHIEPAFKMFLTFRERVNARVDWINHYLEHEFSLEGESTYRPDRKESAWPASEEESNDLWSRRLRYEIVNEMLGSFSEDDEEIADANGIIESKVNNEDGTKSLEITHDEVEVSPETDTLAATETDIAVEADEFDFNTTLADAIKSVKERYENTQKVVNEIEPTEVQEVFLTALTHQYDPHSTYMSADTLEEFAIAMRNSLVGIGALLGSEDGYCTIRELLPGGPAERSRELSPEDQIVGVAQDEDGEFVDTIGMKLNKVVKMIRGKKGTVVKLLIKPAGADPSEREVIKLVRDEIKLTAKLARAEVFEVPHGDRTIPIGVIELPAFYGSGDSSTDHASTTEDVEELINRLKEAHVEGIVLDLRGNGGGLLSEAINLTGLFIPVGPVVQVKDYIGHVQEYLDQDPKVAWDGPLMVLVSRFSASASEITAGALKNHGRALIVGDEETHGKGTVQAVFEMNRSNFLSMLKPRSGAAKVTIQQYYLPDGTSTQIKGVASDIVLPSHNEFLPIGESDLPNALAWDSINSLEWNYDLTPAQENSVIDHELIENLRSLSMSRQSSLDEFSYLQESIDWFRERQEQKEFSLNFDLRREKRIKDNEFRDVMEDRLEAFEHLNYSSSEILLKVAAEQKAEHDAYLKEIEEKEHQAEISTDEVETDETLVLTQKDGEVVSEEIVEDIEEDEGFDIHLREGLRIMADWIALEKPASNKANAAATVSSTDAQSRS